MSIILGQFLIFSRISNFSMMKWKQYRPKITKKTIDYLAQTTHNITCLPPRIMVYSSYSGPAGKILHRNEEVL